VITLHLPFPPTSNHTNGIGRRKDGTPYVYSNKSLKQFQADAKVMYLQQRKSCGTPIEGHFTYHIVLDQSRRAVARDGQNREKYVLDFLQDVGLIKNDKLADGGSWSWGPIDGCLVRAFKTVIA
jgi:Holliday junction resolvase RusA-like endonuclease